MKEITTTLEVCEKLKELDIEYKEYERYKNQITIELTEQNYQNAKKLGII